MEDLGLVRGNGRPNSANSAKLSYADAASETLGVSRRTVAQDLRRGREIEPDVLADVAGTPLDKGVVLDDAHAHAAERSTERWELQPYANVDSVSYKLHTLVWPFDRRHPPPSRAVTTSVNARSLRGGLKSSGIARPPLSSFAALIA